MREHLDEFTRIGLKVVIVTFESDLVARSYLAENESDWPLLLDRDREVYRYYGMLRASFWDLWGPRSWRAYLRELRRGGTLRPATGDIHQRGGDVLIDPEGIVRLHHVGEGPADRPSVATILDRIARTRRWGSIGQV